MKTWVLDASVVVKWFLRERDGEENVQQALAVARDLRSAAIDVLQPPHWLAEVAAVLTRLVPDQAPAATQLLWSLELPVSDDHEVYGDAVRLATRLDHHLFDTLYHAVARHHPTARFLTADQRYLCKTRGNDRVVDLADYSS